MLTSTRGNLCAMDTQKSNKLEDVREFFARHDLFAQHCGIELIEVTPGRALARMPVKQHHLNGLGTVHGGAIFSLADYCFAAACNSHGSVAMALNVNISFIKAARQGSVLTAEAEEMSLGGRTATYMIRITDQDNALVGVFQGLAYRKPEISHDFTRKKRVEPTP